MKYLVKSSTIPFTFSKKHKEYIRKSESSFLSVAEGSVRSGKTTANIFAFAHLLKKSRDKIHLASASNIANAKLILSDGNGFGLEHIFKGQCRLGKYKGNEALFIKGIATNYEEKIIIFCGGGKADSFKSIRGNSYGLWIATEIDLHHKSFIQEAFNRQLASKDIHSFWDLNPNTPKHFIYEDYIDYYNTLDTNYNYKHFTINDNLSIPNERKEEIKSRYKVGSLWYKRSILGLRCLAEGLIYEVFAENKDKLKVKITDDNRKKYYDFITIGVDFGGNGSSHSFTATGIKEDYTKVTALMSKRIEAKGTTADDLISSFFNFIEKCKNKYGDNIKVVYADSAEQTLINTLRAKLEKETFSIKNAKKKSIVDRIRFENIIFNSNVFRYTEDCKSLCDALCEAVYNDKSIEDERLDDGTTDIDSLDSFEYSFERYMKRIIKCGLKE